VIDLGEDPETGAPVRVRIGQYGPFVQRGDGGPGNTASIPDEFPPADLTIDRALELLKLKADGPRVLGVDPQTRQQVYVLHGRFGAYVQLGETPDKSDKGAAKPKRASLTGGMSESSVTLEDALRLLSLPREIGRHPDDGEPIVANFGRFGPYVKHGDEFRSLESDDQVFGIDLDAAVELLRQPKKSRRRQSATRTVLRDLGPHPQSNAPMKLLEGRYGPYVTDGTTNASLPKGTDPAALTVAEAVALLEARAAMPSKKRPARRAGGARKAAGSASAPRARKPEPVEV
jgi:DNA topoisomerase I